MSKSTLKRLAVQKSKNKTCEFLCEAQAYRLQIKRLREALFEASGIIGRASLHLSDLHEKPISDKYKEHAKRFQGIAQDGV